MKSLVISVGGRVLACVAILALCGCSENKPLWRAQKLASGRSVKILAYRLAWGTEHDERIPANDAFALEIVYSTPEMSDEAREREAKEAFELLRAVSEQWDSRVRV
jgi:hypothetical protein